MPSVEGFCRREFPRHSKIAARQFDTDGLAKAASGAHRAAAAIRTWVSAGSISQGLEESQQLFLLRFAQIAESPDDMFSLALVPLDGVLQRE